MRGNRTESLWERKDGLQEDLPKPPRGSLSWLSRYDQYLSEVVRGFSEVLSKTLSEEAFCTRWQISLLIS